MAINFKISQLRCKDSVHINLVGDFDGTSAHELINAIKSHASDVDQVFINTNGLKSVHPFGRTVLFRSLSSQNGQWGNLIFIGDHRRRLSRPWMD